VPPTAGGKLLVGILVVKEPQGDLLEIVPTLQSAGSFSSRLHCWKQQRNQYADYCDHYKQFHKRKTVIKSLLAILVRAVRA